jgi:hypothetical protein
MKIEKCIRLLVQNAIRKQKFLLSQMELALYIARNAIVNENLVDFKFNYLLDYD